MTLVRWDPFRALNQLQDQMNRLFADMVFEPERRGPRETTELAGWMPAADVFERENDYVIALALPGVEPSQVQVHVDGSVLSVRGERTPAPAPLEAAQRRESEYGPFYRCFTLPATVDGGVIHAEHKNGVLIITLPKAQSARPKQIAVQAS